LARSSATLWKVLLVLPKIEVNEPDSEAAPGHPTVAPVCAPVTGTPIQKVVTADAQALAKLDADPLLGSEMAD
jgi:hypothetical protein